MSPVAAFILGLLIFITFMIVGTAYTMGRLNHKIQRRVFQTVERAIIGGILIGTVGMFQPWSLDLYRWGFLVLLLATLFYIVWSHVIPKGIEDEGAERRARWLLGKEDASDLPPIDAG